MTLRNLSLGCSKQQKLLGNLIADVKSDQGGINGVLEVCDLSYLSSGIKDEQ